MRRSSVWSSRLVLSVLACLATCTPSPAAEVTLVLRGVSDKDPFVVSWVDASDGKLSLDNAIAEQIQALFANAHYLFTEQGHLILAHGQGNELKQAFSPTNTARNEARTFFVAHLRSQDKTLFLDGTINRFRDDPTKGFAQWNLLLIGNQGTTISSIIQQDLVFPSSTPPAPQQPSSPIPFPR